MKFVPSEPRIEVAADWQIANRLFYRQNIWEPARRLHPEMGSYAGWMKVLDMIDTLDGRFFFPDRSPWRHPEMSVIFTDDGSKWMSNFLATDATGKLPRAYSPMYERLRCVEVYCRVLNGMCEH